MAKAKKILEAVAKKFAPVVNWFNSRALKFTAVFRREVFIILALALLALACMYAGILFDVLVILALSALLYLILRIIKYSPRKKKKKKPEKKKIFGLTKFWLYFYAVCIVVVVISIAYEYKIIH